MLYRSTYLYDSPGALRMHGNDNSIETSMGILRDQKANRRLDSLGRFSAKVNQKIPRSLEGKTIKSLDYKLLIDDAILAILRVVIVNPLSCLE